jgi:hypothetical protein
MTELQRLLKIRDSLRQLIELGWDIVHIENSLEEELAIINNQIDEITKEDII